jgi:hypothetical protein
MAEQQEKPSLVGIMVDTGRNGKIRCDYITDIKEV